MSCENVISNSSTLVICQNESECSIPSLYACHHCSKRLCLRHINEHNDLNTVRIEELSDEMNKLTDLLSNLNTKKSSENAFDELEKWRQQNHYRIERIYQDHLKAIHQFEGELNMRLNIFKQSLEPTISDLKKQLSHFKKISQTTREQLSPLESELNQLRRYLQSVQCEILVETKDLSFENSVDIKDVFSYNRDLFNKNPVQSYRTLSVEDMTEFVSSKQNRTILWLDNQKQLHYIDKDLQSHPVRLPDLFNHRTREIDTEIIDMKWCSFAEVFLVLFPRYLFSFSPKTRQFTPIPLVRYKGYPFRCISCLNDASLYISYSASGICIEQWKCSYNNEIAMNECLKPWDDLTKNKTEWLASMNTNSALQIGLLIHRGETMYRRFELRDEKLDSLKYISLDQEHVNGIYPFGSRYWFMKSSSGKYYVYSTETDKYSPVKFDFPLGLQEFGKNTIVIGNRKNELIFCDM